VWWGWQLPLLVLPPHSLYSLVPQGQLPATQKPVPPTLRPLVVSDRNQIWVLKTQLKKVSHRKTSARETSGRNSQQKTDDVCIADGHIKQIVPD
jgi:hypothetical protein